MPLTPQQPETDGTQWQLVDEGWGRKVVDFATLAEPSQCREYVALHHQLAVDKDERLLDLACGAGLALELASLRGARCAGIDASPRLIKVARDRLPGADIRVGDMQALPWEDASFEVVTSFRGIWGTTPQALDEAHRVLAPGGRLGFTVWGHIKASPGAWALSPFRLAAEPKVANQAAMVALGRPGVGEDLLARHGFVDVERVSIPFAWEFPDPETYARALASTGPAYEAIQAVGEEEFLRAAEAVAAERVRDGLPLRASIDVIAYLARKPLAPVETTTTWTAPLEASGFIGAATDTPAARAMYDEDLEDLGYVMNCVRLWAHLPAVNEGLFDLMGHSAKLAGLSVRERGILITAMAATMHDSSCSLAWGAKLADVSDPGLAAGVLAGHDTGLSESEQALARWARKVTADPTVTAEDDVEALRRAGYDDTRIVAVTAFIALRQAFAVVNDALGLPPDRELRAHAPAEVRDVVTYGRPVAD
ncbi:MAG: methyltransferase domain-containing protein [Marmoricola sp.]